MDRILFCFLNLKLRKGENSRKAVRKLESDPKNGELNLRMTFRPTVSSSRSKGQDFFVTFDRERPWGRGQTGVSAQRKKNSPITLCPLQRMLTQLCFYLYFISLKIKIGRNSAESIRWEKRKVCQPGQDMTADTFPFPHLPDFISLKIENEVTRKMSILNRRTLSCGRSSNKNGSAWNIRWRHQTLTNLDRAGGHLPSSLVFILNQR